MAGGHWILPSIFPCPEGMNISEKVNAYAGKAYTRYESIGRLPERLSFRSLSIDHVLHLPLAHRMKEKK